MMPERWDTYDDGSVTLTLYPSRDRYARSSPGHWHYSPGERGVESLGLWQSPDPIIEATLEARYQARLQTKEK